MTNTPDTSPLHAPRSWTRTAQSLIDALAPIEALQHEAAVLMDLQRRLAEGTPLVDADDALIPTVTPERAAMIAAALDALADASPSIIRSLEVRFSTRDAAAARTAAFEYAREDAQALADPHAEVAAIRLNAPLELYAGAIMLVDRDASGRSDARPTLRELIDERIATIEAWCAEAVRFNAPAPDPATQRRRSTASARSVWEEAMELEIDLREQTVMAPLRELSGLAFDRDAEAILRLVNTLEESDVDLEQVRVSIVPMEPSRIPPYQAGSARDARHALLDVVPCIEALADIARIDRELQECAARREELRRAYAALPEGDSSERVQLEADQCFMDDNMRRLAEQKHICEAQVLRQQEAMRLPVRRMRIDAIHSPDLLDEHELAWREASRAELVVTLGWLALDRDALVAELPGKSMNTRDPLVLLEQLEAIGDPMDTMLECETIDHCSGGGSTYTRTTGELLHAIRAGRYDYHDSYTILCVLEGAAAIAYEAEIAHDTLLGELAAAGVPTELLSRYRIEQHVSQEGMQTMYFDAIDQWPQVARLTHRQNLERLIASIDTFQAAANALRVRRAEMEQLLNVLPAAATDAAADVDPE